LSIANDVLAEATPASLPIDAPTGDLRLVGETFWYVTSDPVGVWRSSDLQDWQRTDISGMVSPGPTSLEWRPSVSIQETADGTPLAYVAFTVTDPGALLGHPGEPVRLTSDDAGGFVATFSRAMSQGGPVTLGAITLKEEPGVLSFVDSTGVVVGKVESAGIGRDFAESWARRGEIRYDRLYRLDGETWALAELPVAQLPDWPMIVPMGDTTMVFAVEADQRVRGWRTTDGRTWTGGEPLVDGAGKALGSSGVTYQEGKDGPVILVYGADGTSGWRSTDGKTWTFAVELQGGPTGVRFEHGWVRTADLNEGVWQVSRDGSTWQDVPELLGVVTKTAPNGAGGTSEYAIGDTVVFKVDEGDVGPRDIWLIEFAPTGP
jgi:hypothetical protein